MLSGEEGHQYRAIINEKDYVLVYIDDKRKKLVKVRRGAKFNSDKGYFILDEIIGKEVGSKVRLSTGEYAYILRPLLIDILESYKRVTQVIYPKDIGFMIAISGVGPGSRVLEGGVGTGFLTTYLAHLVGDEGRVYAYELRREFLEIAKRNLSKSGLLHRVVLKYGDIRKDVTEDNLDVAFLDIPDPWNALDMLYKVLKPSAPAIAFVPTANQVIKLIDKLRNDKRFVDVKVFDIQLREYNTDPEALRPKPIYVVHTGFIIFFRKVLP